MDEYTHETPPMDPTFDPNDPSLFPARPTWPKVIGIMSIIFGSLAVFCGGIAVFSPLMFAGMVEPQLNGDPIPPNMKIAPATIALTAFSLLFNFVLIGAGVLAVQRKPVTRWTHLGYAVLMVPMTLAAVWWQFEVQAQTLAWAEQYPDNPIAQQQITQNQQMGNALAIIGAVITLLITLAWPLFCMIWFGLIKTKPSHVTGEIEPEADYAAA